MAREHEVGRAVDDPDQLVDAGRGERLLQHAHDGDGRAGRGLVAQLRAAAVGGLLQLGAVAREQLLVGRDDRDAALEQLAQVAERRLDAAHDLGHDLDRGVVADVLEAVGEQARAPRPRARRAASRTSARTTRTGRPATRSTTSARSRSRRSTDEPTVPYPSRPMPSGSLVTGPDDRGLCRAPALRSRAHAGCVARDGKHAVVVGCGRVGSAVACGSPRAAGTWR